MSAQCERAMTTKMMTTTTTTKCRSKQSCRNRPSADAKRAAWSSWHRPRRHCPRDIHVPHWRRHQARATCTLMRADAREEARISDENKDVRQYFFIFVPGHKNIELTLYSEIICYVWVKHAQSIKNSCYFLGAYVWVNNICCFLGAYVWVKKYLLFSECLCVGG